MQVYYISLLNLQVHTLFHTPFLLDPGGSWPKVLVGLSHLHTVAIIVTIHSVMQLHCQ